MSSKQGGRGGGSGKGKKHAKADAGEQKTEDVLQAVIIADTFQDRVRPFSLETPRCLLPLANAPLIEYTLEYLAMNGVQEVFVYCGNHHEKIEKYIQDSPRWSPKSDLSPFSSLEFIRVSDANSIGDFLRDLDKRALIGGDFVLVHGDMVANIPLDDALAKHKARREKNRDACMTVVLRSGGEEEHRTKMNGITPIFVVDSNTGQCLHYEETHPLQKDHYLTLDPAIFENGHPDVDIRSDLIDCGIDICTPEVLALWSESFDYELPRKNFLHGVLKDWELNGKIIHAEIVEEGYAARASTLQMYDSISKDILGRWTYPFVPDRNLLLDQSYRITRGGSCLEDKVSTGEDCEVSRCVVGRNTTLENDSKISNSIIGRGCKIGQNVRIHDSYIWDNVTIADGTTVYRSILASSVVVGRDCTIPEGSLLSFGVQLGDKISLPETPTSALSLLAYDGSSVQADSSLVGSAGKGAIYREEVDEDEDEDDDPSVLQQSLIYSLAGLNISASSISTLASGDDSDVDEVTSQVDSLHTSELSLGRERLSSFASDDSSSLAAKGAFHHDAVHGLVDALRADNTDDFDSAKLEFMGLRLSNNASDHSMQRAIAVAFVRRAAELMGPEHKLEPTKAAQTAFTSKKGAVKFVKEVGVGGDEVDKQVSFALALQKALVAVKTLELARAGNLLAAMLQQLYGLDVLDEDGILAWWADKRASEGESMSTVKEKCRVLVEWLENDDDDDDDDDDEDEDEDE